NWLRKQNTNAAEVVHLFQEKYLEWPPISQDIVSKIEKQFRERGHVRRQTASVLNISHSSILRVLTENQMHSYKLVPTNELAEDDFDRRILFW
ncbi:hypothetical protein NQ318_007032, partial [Aromia moschata]